MRIGDHQPEIDALLREHFPEPNGNGHGSGAHGASAFRSDQTIVEKLCSEKNGKFLRLWHGDLRDYDGDHSRGDDAFVAKTYSYTQDEDQIRRIHAASWLHRPEKSGRRHDYLQRSIDRARRNVTWFYSWPKSGAEGTGTGTGSPIGNGTGTASKERAKERPLLRPVRFRDLDEPEPRQDILEGLVAEAHPAMIYGDGGVAKSYVALAGAMKISRGTGKFLGRKIMQTPVGFLDFELDAEEQYRRAMRLAKGGGHAHPPDDLLYMCALGMKPRDAFGDALLACKQHDAKLLIVDSLSIAMEGDVEAARDVIGFHQDVIAPFREAGIAVLALDHQSKLQNGERYQNKKAFGSVFKSNLARSVIQIEATERGEDSLTLRLRQVKFNFGPLAEPFGVKLGFEAEQVTVQAVELEDTDLAEEGTLNARDRVRLALRALGEATRNEVHEKVFDLASTTVKKELSKLRDLGEVEETGEVRDRQQVVRLTGTGTGTYKGTGTGTGKDSEPPAESELFEDHDPEDAALLAAGWKPRDRGDTSFWVSPESGFAYSREMALAQLERGREEQGES